MPIVSDDAADVSSRLSAKRLWMILGLMLLGLVVLIPIVAWKSVFETRPTDAELEAALAENAKQVVPPDELDHDSEPSEDVSPDELRAIEHESKSLLIRAISLDELEQIAAEGEPVLYTFRGQSVTWKDMTGIPFADSLRAARRIDQTIPEADHRRELTQLGRGVDLAPGTTGQMTSTATVGEHRINSQLYSHIQRGWAHCVGRTFVGDQGIDLTKRIDFAAADDAIVQSLRIQKEWLRFWEALAYDRTIGRAEEFYDASPLLQAAQSRKEMREIVAAELSSPFSLSAALKVQAALMPFGSHDDPTPPNWVQYELESCLYRIAAIDHAALDPSLFVPLVEEREAPRDVIRFSYYAPHERASVEALVRSFLKPDRRVDVAKAESFHQSREAIGLVTFVLTNTNAPIKGISTTQFPLSTARSMWKGITPGKLFFERQAGPSSDYYGFVYLGEPLLGPSKRGHDPLADYAARNDVLDAIGRDYWRKLKGDFRMNPRFSMTPYALTVKWRDWSSWPIDWRSVKSPVVKEVPAERTVIDDVFKRLSPELIAKFSNCKTLEEHWHAGRWRAFRLLLEEERKGRGIKLDNEHELLLIRWQSLPSVEFAPR